ncbi:MAG: hypothetical protein RL223_2372 [Pseudomonadota bacterium]
MAATGFLLHGLPRPRHPADPACRHPADAAQRRDPVVLRSGLRDLRHAQCRAQQRGAGLPRAQRQPPCGRHPRGQAPQRRLVGQPGRPGQAAGHRPLLRHRRQQPGQLLRFDRADAPQPGHRAALGRGLPRRHGRGLGRRPGAGAGRARHRAAGRRHRRQPGRHAGAELVAAPSAAPARVHRDRHRAQPVGAEHRLQRGRAARHRHRSGLPRRPLLRPRRGAAARPARGAHDRPHHLPQRRRDGTRATSSASTSTPTPTC